MKILSPPTGVGVVAIFFFFFFLVFCPGRGGNWDEVDLFWELLCSTQTYDMVVVG